MSGGCWVAGRKAPHWRARAARDYPHRFSRVVFRRAMRILVSSVMHVPRTALVDTLSAVSDTISQEKYDLTVAEVRGSGCSKSFVGSSVSNRQMRWTL